MHAESAEKWVARYVPSITVLDRDDWQTCFSSEIEGYDYHHAMEKAGIPGFSFGWYILESGRVLLAVIPAFITTYDLATTSHGLSRKMIIAVQKIVPGGLSFTLSCLGRPETERCLLGFHPGLDKKQQTEALRYLLQFWQEHTKEQGIGLLGIKDIDDNSLAQFQACLHEEGFQSLSGLPSAFLDIDFDGVDGYFKKLSASTRKDMRRKLRAGKGLTVIRRDNVDDVIDGLMRMYVTVRNRSEWKFEELSQAFFLTLLEEMRGRAFFLLYYHQEELIGANLLIEDQGIMLDKLFFVKEGAGRAFNLYFISWFHNVKYCVENGIRQYFCGQGAGEVKRRLGCSMRGNRIFFKHKNRLINFMFFLLSPLFSMK